MKKSTVFTKTMVQILQEIEWSYARSGGPGGQNVNKTSTKVHLKWHVPSSSLKEEVKHRLLLTFKNKFDQDGNLCISSQKTRDQDQNRADCLAKVEEMIISVWLPPKIRKATKPTKGSKERRLAGKSLRSNTKKNRQHSRQKMRNMDS